ncbi:MAG: DUF6883 domain-containing protein [Tepidisphaeraceae bacterium]
MKIPPDAQIVRDKLTKYLLVRRLKDDKSGYLSRAGFGISDPDALEAAIRQVISQRDATVDRANEHGTYYNVRGELTGPNGRRLPVILIWLCRLDGMFSFITLVPPKERRQ